MSETLGSWFGAIANLFDPYLQTVEALWSLAANAEIGTLIVGIALLLISLELLRASKGWISYLWRLTSIGAAGFLIAAIVYGDFLAGPAKAAYTLISERAAVVPPETAAWTTVGVASVGVLAYIGRRSALRVHAGEEPRWRPYRGTKIVRSGFDVAELTRVVTLDPAGRLQLRLFTRNAKKPINAVKPARGLVRRA